jgi:hypothetical protein
MTRASDVLTSELVEQLRHLVQTQTEYLERLGGQVMNHVQEVGKFTFDAAATPMQKDYPVAIGCIVVNNTSDTTVTVVSGAAAGSVPTSGLGAFDVAAGTQRTVPIGGHVVTVYGAAAKSFSFAIFTLGAAPVAG